MFIFFLKGLFAHDHMAYEVERKPESQPSLREMTEAAIKILEKSKNGYFLLVEGDFQIYSKDNKNRSCFLDSIARHIKRLSF